MASQKDVDEILVLRFQGGDRSAFDLLAAKYQGRLFRVVSRVVHNRSDAEDAVQETLIQVYRGLPGFRRDAAFYTWIFQIGMNVAKKLRKTQMLRAHVSVQLHQETEEPTSQELVAVDARSPLSALESKRAVVALNEALAAMPPKMSMPLLLRELEGKTYEEIAVIMGCPIGTVRSRIFRARELIAEKI